MQNIIVTNQVLNEKNEIKVDYENQYTSISDLLYIHDMLCIHHPEYAQIANNVLCSQNITFEETKNKLYYVYQMWLRKVLKTKEDLWIYKSNNDNFEFFLFNDNSPTELSIINLNLISTFKHKDFIFDRLSRHFGWSRIENNFFLNYFFWMIPDKTAKKSVIKSAKKEYLENHDCDSFVFDMMMEIQHKTSMFLQESKIIDTDLSEIKEFLKTTNSESEIERQVLYHMTTQSDMRLDTRSFYQIYDNVYSDKSYGLCTKFSKEFSVEPFFSFEYENSPIAEYSNVIPLFVKNKEELEIIQELIEEDDLYLSETFGMTPIETKCYPLKLQSSRNDILEFLNTVRSRENAVTEVINCLQMI